MKRLFSLSNLSIYYIWKNISSYNNNKFKISAPTWNDKFDRSYFVSDTQDYFSRYSRVYFKKHGEDIDKPSVQIYVNEIENRVTLKIKNGYSLELLILETMKLLGSIENKITQDKSSENVPHLEITEVVFVHYDIVKNVCLQYSRVLFTFVLNKRFDSLLEISATNHIFLKTFNSVYDEIKVSFTDQNTQPLEIEGKINLTMMIR